MSGPELSENGDAAAPSGVTPQAKETKLCGVCSQNESKYKCARCELPYCSVPCATLHRAEHPVVEEPVPSELKSVSPKPAPVNGSARPGTVGGALAGNAFAVLEESKELQTLFSNYPRLKSQLRDIYQFTLPPAEGGMGMNQYQVHSQNQYGGQIQGGGSHARGGQRGRGGNRNEKSNGSRGPWTTDQGMQDAIDAFSRAKEEYGKGGEGIREYAELVMKLVNQNDHDVAEQVQNEVAEDNLKLITQLLNVENH